MTKRIHILDDETINKIAAGEVVERPSSVVKELVENAIDAKSTSIIIEIKDGGKKYIRITDNGMGIQGDDLEVAVLRHATSKITNSEDLNNLISLGFRGEALASIASVSHMQIITKAIDSTSGRQLDIDGGQIAKNEEVGCPKGTTVIVKNLFYNTPVRRKFLKSDKVESANISSIVYKLALSYPEISFKFLKDNKVLIRTPGDNNLKTTIYSLFGRNFSDSLFKINYSGDDIKMTGFISNPSFTRGNRGHQYFFVNDRFINSKMLSDALEEVYKTLVPINRFPVCVLMLYVDPRKVDVNIHPNKTEARFEEEKRITKILTETVKRVLRQNNLIPEVRIGSDRKRMKNSEKQKSFLDLDNSVSPFSVDSENPSSNKNEKYNEFLSGYNNKHKEPSTIHEELDIDQIDVKHTNTTAVHEAKEGYLDLEYEDSTQSFSKEVENLKRESEPIETSRQIIPKLRFIGTLFTTYILAEDVENQVFYLIDQHAAHERIMYEKFKDDFLNDKVVVQSLLAPEIIDLTHGEIQLFKDNIQLFNNLGFEVEEFGMNSVILRGVPLVFGKPDSTSLFIDILDHLHSEIRSTYDLKLERIMKLACTNAIKGGDIIREPEINSLIEVLRKAENPYTCPHGRPIIIKMTKYEIEKKFKRIQ